MKFQQSPNTYVSEITLLTSNWDEMIRFYYSLLGFKEMVRTSHRAVFSADGRTPLITLEKKEGLFPKEPRRSGLYHFALLLPSRKDLAAFLHHFAGTGWPIQGASDHLVSEAVYFADPDGNGIEVYADRPDDTWIWQNSAVQMATEPLRVNELLAEATAREWNGMPAETGMGHIHLHVSSLTEAGTFYTEGLGFEPVAEYGSQALFLSTGGYHHHIGLNTWNGTGAPSPSENSARMASFTITYPSEEKREAAAGRLKGLGASLAYSGQEIRTADPSGNWIILQIVKRES
ncbi:glyoxalase [Bacillus mangrovi]|uniref:Glyoxalase n=1 Tax=Metabacillus mangrovi TaxID=1491830 RepID=A0A7X2S573_9BACI|nr:VOC family protein [Metabacillus mangrovi]MTH53617.1 glyoxalase [Metabacillus mangrovi]